MAKPTPSPTVQPDHLLGVLRSLWRHRRAIVIATLSAAVVTAVVSLFLPEYFTGQTTFVAISPQQVSIEGTFGAGDSRVQFYGTSEDIDRLLAIAESDEVIEYMIDRFDLYDVYAIDSSTQKGPLYVRRTFLGNYEIEKTPRDALQLRITDRSPKRAAEMANAARERIDAVNLALIRSTHRRNAEGLRQDIRNRETQIDSLNTTLARLRLESGVYDTEAQSEALSVRSSSLDQRDADVRARYEAYSRRGGPSARDSTQKLSIELEGIERAREAVDAQLAKLNDRIGDIQGLQEQREQATEVLGYVKVRLRQFETVLESDRSTVEIIELARTPVVKSWPIRWLMVAAATVITFIFSVFAALLYESGKRYDWARVVN